jgi:hypothetical protein
MMTAAQKEREGQQVEREINSQNRPWKISLLVVYLFQPVTNTRTARKLMTASFCPHCWLGWSHSLSYTLDATKKSVTALPFPTTLAWGASAQHAYMSCTHREGCRRLSWAISETQCSPLLTTWGRHGAPKLGPGKSRDELGLAGAQFADALSLIPLPITSFLFLRHTKQGRAISQSTTT